MGPGAQIETALLDFGMPNEDEYQA
jgi:hypothetical protein